MTEEDKLKKLQDLNSSILKSQPLKRFSESIAKNFNLSEHLALPYLNSELLMNQTKAFFPLNSELSKLSESIKGLHLPQMSEILKGNNLVENALKPMTDQFSKVATNSVLHSFSNSLNYSNNKEEEDSLIKITKVKLTNFRFFGIENNEFDFENKNVLIYGENGSGKSSLYKALEILGKLGQGNIKKEFENNKNIFYPDKESFLEFTFSNEQSLTINTDFESTEEFYFIKQLFIYQPFLDYKKLLKVHYSTKNSTINLYSMFVELFNH